MAVTFFWSRRLRSAIAQNDRMKLRIDLQLAKLKLSLVFAGFSKNVPQNVICFTYALKMAFWDTFFRKHSKPQG